VTAKARGVGKARAGAARRPARRARRGRHRFIILTGLSGSGKSHAIRALEDLGYFCIDNLPAQLIPTVADLAAREDAGLEKVALVVDVRERSFLADFPRTYRALRARGPVEPTLIFLEASHSALVRRFSETRRPHPLARDRSVPEGITEERERLNRIRRMADLVLDTTNLTVHDLRSAFMRLSGDKHASPGLVVNLLSFGFKRGLPLDADLVFDVRCLPNPHFVDRLRPLTGLDAPVVRYMRRYEATGDFIDRLAAFLRFALPQYVAEGKSYLTVAIGCTGGRHRSVMVAEELRDALAKVKGVSLRVTHRDAGR
jgi:UPF0042 nucleotide-binding protein